MVAAARQFVRLPPQGIRDRPDTRFGFFRRIGQESELAPQQLGMVPYVLPAPKVGDEEPEGGERHEENGDQGAELVRQHLHRKVPAERAVDVGEAEGEPDGRKQIGRASCTTEGVRPCRSWWSPLHDNNTNYNTIPKHF